MPLENVSPSFVTWDIVLDKLKGYVNNIGPEDGPAQDTADNEYLLKNNKRSTMRLGDINHIDYLGLKNQKSDARRDSLRQSFDFQRLNAGVKPRQVKVLDDVED